MKTRILLACLLMLAFTGCNVHSKLQCPTYSGRNIKHPMWARHTPIEHKAKPTPIQAAQTPKEKPAFIASLEGKPMEIKLPKIVSRHMNDGDIEEANKIYKEESNNNVQLERRANNRVYVHASSPKALVNLTKALTAKKPASSAAAGYLDDRGSRMAFASGLLGIVAFLAAFGPYAWFFAVGGGIAAIVLGVFGLHSARRGWAITGIVLGSIALFISLVFIAVFFSVTILI
ncbi:MAG: hypothetical protein JWO06_818 [Bacteroidota bacterium]|nr:hypothetical protein [Bacteroidota bacterium]